MSTEIELSVDETNALRAKLGLPPLRVPNPPAVLNSLSLETRKKETSNDQQRKSTGNLAENDEGNSDDDTPIKIDEQRLQSLEHGAVMVLDDLNVLDEQQGSKGLVLPGEAQASNTEDRNGSDSKTDAISGKKRKLDKRDFVSSLARSDGPVPTDAEEGDLDQLKAIPGARLFESDRIVGTEESAELDSKAKKKLRRSTAPEQVKIIRRPVHRGNTLGIGEDEIGELDKTAMEIVPRAYNQGTTIVPEDEDDELETSLARARQAKLNNQKSSIKDRVDATTQQIQNMNTEDVEVYVPTSEFVRIVIEPELELGTNSKSETALSAEPAATAVKVENETASLEHITSEPLTGVAPAGLPAQPNLQPKDKSHRRGLGGTLALLRETGANKVLDEVIVGRARDARPIMDLNKPEDSVVLEYRDDYGRLMKPKEAYRQMKYQFRGEGPGAKKREKRERQLQREQASRSDASSSASGAAVQDLLPGVKKDHIVLWKN